MALILTVIAVVVYCTVGKRIDLYTLEKFFWMRGPRPVLSEVVVVAIDDATYQAVGASTSYPLPRRVLAEALENIQRADPKLLILDAKIPNERMLDAVADERIRQVLLATPSTIWSGDIGDAKDSSTKARISSDEQFRAAAKIELPMTIYGLFDSFVYLGSPYLEEGSLFEIVPIAKPLVELAGMNISRPNPGDMTNFYGPAEYLPRLSVHNLLGTPGKDILEHVRGKIVLVGYQSRYFARGRMAKDEFSTPASPRGMFGVEIHATIIANLIDRTWIRCFNHVTEVTVVAALVFFLAAYLMRAPTPFTIGMVWTVVVVTYIANYFAFARMYFFFWGLASLLLAASIMTAFSALYFLIRANRYKRYVDQTFSFEQEREL
jgi:CHASE2 domain-containing sensor protein